MLSNGAELQRHLFMSKVEDPKKSMHYTGKNKLFYHFDVQVARCLIFVSTRYGQRLSQHDL